MSDSLSTPRQPLNPAQVDGASRWPVLWMLVKAAGWLAIGLGLSVWGWGRLLYPEEVGTAAWATYGRLWPAAQHVLFYGFATQAGATLGLWMLARLSGVALQQRWLVFLGGILWNLGVFLGVLGILFGDGSGYVLWQAPLYGSGVMWAGVAAFCASAWFTFQQRRRAEVYPSQWWTMAGLFWLFWLMSIGVVLLHCAPPRGVMQVVVSTWLANNLLMLWLTSAGLAALFYFVPRWSGRPLHSVAMSKMVFWVVATVGTAGGFHFGMPVPRWLPAVSAVADLMVLVAVLALALNIHRTMGGQYGGMWRQPGFLLTLFGALMWMLVLVLQAVLSRPALQDVVNLTFLTAGRSSLWLLGFALPVMAGAMMYVVPRLATGQEGCNCAKSRAVAAGLMIGAVLWMAGLLWAGNAQANALADWRTPFMQSLAAALPGMKLAGLGLLAILVSGVVMTGALIWMGCGALWATLRGTVVADRVATAEEVVA